MLIVSDHISSRMFIRYHAANFETTKASLTRLVANYTPRKEDETLVDQLNLCSSAEYMADAKSNPHLFKDINSLAGVLEGLPFIGRAVEMHESPDCIQINPWVGSIKSIPMIIKAISTHDLYVQYNGSMEVSNEKINSIIILGGVKDCPGIFCHLQSFAITKNWLLYFPESRLAAASMLMLHVLGNNEPAAWKLEELCHVRSICDLHTPINSRWWHDYLNCLKTPQFRKCLVTESPKLEKWMTCPGLGKFLLGMWWCADQGYRFTDLSDRFQAIAVELLGRCKLEAETFFAVSHLEREPQDCNKPAITDALDAVTRALKISHLTKRNITYLLQCTLEAQIKKAKTAAMEEITITFKAEDLRKVAHFNLSIEHIGNFFAGLSQKQAQTLDLPECIEWTGPSDATLMKALMIATAHTNSFDRNHPTRLVDASQDDIFRSMKGRMAGGICKYTGKAIVGDANDRITTQLHTCHMGLPRPIPNALVLRYKEETGRDIAETWQLDPETGLSPIACCYPCCDLYLVIPKGNVLKQRAVIRAHMSTCCKNFIPGLHKCVQRNSHLPTSEIARLVESGTELGEPFLPRDVTRRLRKGTGVYGGVPRSFASPEEYKKHALGVEFEAFHGKIRKYIEEFTGGNPMVLYNAINDIKNSLNTESWEYSLFKKTFDEKYTALGQ